MRAYPGRPEDGQAWSSVVRSGKTPKTCKKSSARKQRGGSNPNLVLVIDILTFNNLRKDCGSIRNKPGFSFRSSYNVENRCNADDACVR